MSKLSLDGVQFLIKNCMSKTPLSVILQAIHAKDKNTDKISQQLSVSCGNLHILALIPVALKEKLKANGEQYTVSAYDIIKVTSCKLNSTNDKTIIIIKDMSIIKTGLTSKIGNPLYYDDCNKNGNFPIIKVENTIIPGAKEESKESPRISSAIMRKSGICMSEIDEDDYAPIKSLNTMNPDWIILAKVTAKTDLREFNSRDGGKGKLFNFDLMDIHGDQINVTCFNKAVDKFYDLVQQGKVYKVSRGSVRPANKRFTAIKNDFSIILDDKAQVELVEDSGKSKFKDSAFSFSKISEISTFGITRTVDFLGIIFEDLGIKVITTKAGIERRIRTLTLIDDSKVDADEEVNLAINIGIWGELGENLNAKPGDILAFKNLKASEFRGGIQLNNFGADLIFTKDSLKQVKEAHMLIRWYRELSIKNIKNISDGDGSSDSFSKSEHVPILDDAITKGLEKFYFTGYIQMIRTDERSVYPSCPKCNKKVTQEIGTGLWSCQKCVVSHEKPQYGYILSAMVSDGFNNSYIWANFFRKEAEFILGGLTADDYQKLISAESSDNEAIKDVGLVNKNKVYKFLMKVTKEIYNGEEKSRYHVIKVEKVSYSLENKRLISILSNYTSQK